VTAHRDALTEALVANGHAAVCVDGAQAVRLFAMESFDLVLPDLMFAVMNGCDVPPHS
jgi:CheY-like chemotaxis protein